MCDLCDGTTFCQLNVCSDCKTIIDNMEQMIDENERLKKDYAELRKKYRMAKVAVLNREAIIKHLKGEK